MWLRPLAKHLLAIFMTGLLGGLLGATLVRLAPGFGVDERELDPRLNEQTLQVLRQLHAGERNLFHFYLHHLIGLFRGDFGFSRTTERPIAELLRDRMPVTLHSVGIGLMLGWFLGFTLAMPTTAVHSAI